MMCDGITFIEIKTSREGRNPPRWMYVAEHEESPYSYISWFRFFRNISGLDSHIVLILLEVVSSEREGKKCPYLA
jgi:hypothetical protein